MKAHTILVWNDDVIRIVRMDVDDYDEVEEHCQNLRKEMHAGEDPRWQILDGHPTVDSYTRRP